MLDIRAWMKHVTKNDVIPQTLSLDSWGWANKQHAIMPNASHYFHVHAGMRPCSSITSFSPKNVIGSPICRSICRTLRSSVGTTVAFILLFSSKSLTFASWMSISRLMDCTMKSGTS